MCNNSGDTTRGKTDLFQRSSIREQQLSSQSVDRQSETEMRHQELQRCTKSKTKKYDKLKQLSQTNK